MIMNKYHIFNNVQSNIVVGSHDDLELTVSYFENAYTTKPIEFDISVMDFKRILIEAAMLKHVVKEKAPAISPSQYQPNAKKRTNEFGVSRNFMILDFDNGPDIQFIQDQLSKFMYFMWTTHSHQVPNKGERYRVFLPFDFPISYPDWSSKYSKKFILYFESIGFVNNNAVDKSAYKFGQLAFLPGINPEVGFVDLWFNDGQDTKIFSLNLLPEVEDIVDIKEKEYKPLVWQPADDDIKYLIECLLKKTELNQINSSPITGDNGLNRKTIAAALQSIGASYSDFSMLDSVMKKSSSNTNSVRAWEHANKGRITKHPGVLLKLLTPLERKLCGIKFGN